jgi:phage gp36-like protein
VGNYADSDDLIARFDSNQTVAFLTGDGETTQTPDTAVLNEVIDDSEGIIDSSLGMRYEIPVSAANLAAHSVLAARLKSLTLDLAVRRLHRRIDRDSVVGTEAEAAAMEYLELMRDGKIVLPAGATLTGTVSRTPVVDYGIGEASEDDERRVFTRETQTES